MKEKCPICNKEFASVKKHMAMKHKKQYDLTAPVDSRQQEVKEEEETIVNEEIMEEDEIETTEDDSDKVTRKELRNSIFDGASDDYKGMSLEAYLTKKNITLRELNSIIAQFKGEKDVPVDVLLHNRKEFGEREALKLKDEPKVTVKELIVAEVLSTKYGFTVTDVKSPSKSNPFKLWTLIKK